LKNKLIGDRAFYSRVLAIMLPILVQNLITNCVNLLDNLMVGQIGTESMSGVAIVTQLIFVYNLAGFGLLSGSGILGAQYYGKGDHDGVRNVFRFKLISMALLIAAAYTIFLSGGEYLITRFLHEGGENLDLALTLSEGKRYLSVMLWQIVPFGISQVYSSTLRESGDTATPMKAGLVAVFVNLFGNYLLIYGKLGLPAMGVVGAALATVISRYVECAIVIVRAHSAKLPFMKGVFSSFKIPSELVKLAVKMGAPLFINEFLWSMSVVLINQNLSLRGLEVVSALNISATISNLFACSYIAMGNAIAIIVGQILGSGDLKRAVDEDNKLLFLQFVVSFTIAVLMALFAPTIAGFYNTTPLVKELASSFIRITALWLPIDAVVVAFYFTMRCGGKTFITFIFDSCFSCCVTVPVAMLLIRFTSLPIVPVYFLQGGTVILKFALGVYFMRSKKWVNNLVG